MAGTVVVEPGTVIAGFRVQRLIGEGSLGPVYEAVQVSLGRAVALRLIDERRFSDPAFAERFDSQQRRCASLHHPALVPTYEAGAWEGGRFVATRFVRGRTLAAGIREGSLPPWPVDELLVPVAEALGTAHAAGLAHGRMSAQNVLVDEAGRAYIADLGLGWAGDPAADRRALEALTTEVRRAAGTRTGRRSVRVTALAGAGLVAAGIALWAALGGGDDAQRLPAPGAPAGTMSVGSPLGPGPLEEGGCAAEPGPNTPECTLVQESVGGEPALISKRGVVRQWAVRGAGGALALAVFYERDGNRIVRGFTQALEVAGPEPVAFPADIPVRPGDQVGVILAPGALIGMRDGGQDSIFARSEGGLPGSVRPPDVTSLEGELLLRVDVDPGARPEASAGLSGRRARTAEAGRTVAQLVISRPGGGSAKVRAVSWDDEVAIDLLLGERRLQRVAVEGADPDGTLIELQRHCGTNQGFCIRWANGGGARPVFHEYVLAADGRSLVTIG